MGRSLNTGAHPHPMRAEDVTEDMLPKTDSIWQDTYALSTREVKVLGATETGTKVPMWYVRCEEQYGFNRTFHILAHGFLSRFEGKK